MVNTFAWSYNMMHSLITYPIVTKRKQYGMANLEIEIHFEISHLVRRNPLPAYFSIIIALALEFVHGGMCIKEIKQECAHNKQYTSGFMAEY